MMNMNEHISSNACVARKIPGPLSRSGGDCTNRNVLPSPAPPAHATGIEGTLASSSTSSLPVSSIKRSVSTDTMSQAQNAVPGRPINITSSQIKTTCLLCAGQVFVSCEDSKSKVALQRNRIIKVLCFHLQMEEKDIPKICTPEMFPFCHVCDRLVGQLYENEQVIQAAQDRISKGINTIERTVADAELLGNQGNVGSAEERKFVKLRQAILDGYKTKLVMKQKLRDNLSLGVTDSKMTEPSCSHTSIYHDKSISRQYNRASSSGSLSLQTAPLTTDTRARGRDAAETVSGRSTTMNMSTGAIGASNDGRRQQSPENDGLLNEFGQRRIPNQVISLQRSSHQQSLSQSSSELPMRRSVIRTGSGGDFHSRDPRFGSQQPPITGSNATNAVHPVIVKQEPRDESEFTPMPVVHGKRRRRQLFQGIEIIKVSDPLTNQLYLQCSICNQAIVYKANTPGMSSFQKMTLHITEKHLGKKRKRAYFAESDTSSSRKRQFTCKVCTKVFENKKSLFDHKETHTSQGSPVQPAAKSPKSSPTKKPRSPTDPKKYYSQDLTCDICGKPVKGTLNNLYIHKFSHKNNEERQAAIEAGEKGVRNSMMRSGSGSSRRQQNSTSSAALNLASLKVKKKPRGKYNISKKIKKRGRGGRVSGVVAVNENREGTLECKVCDRKFERACHLALHVNGHVRRAALQVMPPKKRSKTSHSLPQQVLQEETEQQEQEEAAEDFEDELPQDQEYAEELPNNGTDGSFDATTDNSQYETMLETSMEQENDSSNLTN